MGCPANTPPCNMGNDNSTYLSNINGSAISADSTGMQIVDQNGNLILNYNLISSTYNSIVFHELVPDLPQGTMVDTVLRPYLGKSIIYKLDISKTGNPPNIIELEVKLKSESIWYKITQFLQKISDVLR